MYIVHTNKYVIIQIIFIEKLMMGVVGHHLNTKFHTVGSRDRKAEQDATIWMVLHASCWQWKGWNDPSAWSHNGLFIHHAGDNIRLKPALGIS